MAYPGLFRAVVNRLDQSIRGDRGWFLITRVHLNSSRLRDIAVYLHNIGSGESRPLRARDYSAIAVAIGIGGPDPGVTLRRHHLLAMETPLNLLQRVGGRYWRRVQLTELGIILATQPDTSAVLERGLAEIVFCREPWYTPTRVAEYEDFEIRPYSAALQVMERCDGWVDRDEHDLFVSRIRSNDEIQWAAECIVQFRELDEQQRGELLQEVRRRIRGAKAYQNWRDMGLHTFSLFSMGMSAIRADQRLMLTTRMVESVAAPRFRRVPPGRRAGRQPRAALRIPSPAATAQVSVPPPAPAVNPGTEAEILVGKLLKAAGWEVVYYTNRRGFGFDLWARRGNSAIVVEVKSSVDRLGSVTLTRLEYEAGVQYGRNYLLAVVENLGQSPTIRFIQNPGNTVRIERIDTLEYRIARDAWETAAQPFEALVED